MGKRNNYFNDHEASASPLKGTGGGRGGSRKRKQLTVATTDAQRARFTFDDEIPETSRGEGRERGRAGKKVTDGGPDIVVTSGKRDIYLSLSLSIYIYIGYMSILDNRVYHIS